MELRIYLRAFFDLLLPRTCEVCGRRLSVHEDNLCVYCRADLPLTFNWSSTHNTMADKFNALIQRDLEMEDPFGTDTIEQFGAGAGDSIEQSGVGAGCSIEQSGAGAGDSIEQSGVGAGCSIEQSGVGAGDSIEQSGVGAGDGPVDDAPEDAVSGREPYAFAAALFFYRSGSRYREITKSLKYRGNIALGREMAGMLGRRIASAPHFQDVDIVMPVPLHWTRRWSRGYNQAEVIAREIACALAASREDSRAVSCDDSCAVPLEDSRAAPCDDSCAVSCGDFRALEGRGGFLAEGTSVRLDCRTLVRVRRTRTQTHLSVGEKARNVSSAFAVRGHLRDSWRRPSFAAGESAGGSGFSGGEGGARPRQFGVSGGGGSAGPSGWGEIDNHSGTSGGGGSAVPRHILIVDDVFTTGATVNECRKVLRARFGPSVRISVATLAFVGD